MFSSLSLDRAIGESLRNLRAMVIAVGSVSSPGIIISMMFWLIMSGLRRALELESSLSRNSASNTSFTASPSSSASLSIISFFSFFLSSTIFLTIFTILSFDFKDLYSLVPGNLRGKQINPLMNSANSLYRKSNSSPGPTLIRTLTKTGNVILLT
ncbi:hypothetical protein V8G54_016762 [Vigna mungo]|uniref:Uncharacterized protein n=1 Tax=Vigna mungo TaxID=3915 RepID=A0AAQ3NPG3_VIGMU